MAGGGSTDDGGVGTGGGRLIGRVGPAVAWAPATDCDAGVLSDGRRRGGVGSWDPLPKKNKIIISEINKKNKITGTLFPKKQQK